MPRMTAQEEATAFKQTGNKAVANHEWLNAIEAYSKAIELDEKDATFFCNRAQVNLDWCVDHGTSDFLTFCRRT